MNAHRGLGHSIKETDTEFLGSCISTLVLTTFRIRAISPILSLTQLLPQ
jgi:hypothetical protein